MYRIEQKGKIRWGYNILMTTYATNRNKNNTYGGLAYQEPWDIL